jgi:hypothetical protein
MQLNGQVFNEFSGGATCWRVSCTAHGRSKEFKPTHKLTPSGSNVHQVPGTDRLHRRELSGRTQRAHSTAAACAIPAPAAVLCSATIRARIATTPISHGLWRR